MRRSVVLPQPDGPSMQTNVPFGTASDTRSTATSAGKALRYIFENQTGHHGLSTMDDVAGMIGWAVATPREACRRTATTQSRRRKSYQPTISSVHFWFSQSDLD